MDLNIDADDGFMDMNVLLDDDNEHNVVNDENDDSSSSAESLPSAPHAPKVFLNPDGNFQQIWDDARALLGTNLQL